MRTTTTLCAIFCVLSFGTLSQHDHEELEHLFSKHSLSDFENLIGVQDSNIQNMRYLNFIDSTYQNFHKSIEQRLRNGEEISDGQFSLEYLELVSNVASIKNNFDKPLDIDFTPKALNGPCVNMDFETGDVSGWELTRGNVDGSAPYSYVGEFVVGPGPYHQVFGGGVDPVTGISRVNPLGGGFSARLGNGTGVGARAARLRQTFLVDSTNFMFTYSYAVIFQSPVGHALNQLPYFTVRVFDSLGNSVPCGEYSVIADASNASNYQSASYGGSTVLYKDWETVFTNLSAFIGQNVTIEFTSGDCSLTGHFGYAYVDASCGMSSVIASQSTICTGDSSILTAPAGAASYSWSNGATTQSTTVYTGGTYTCTLTPFQGGGCSIDLDISIEEYPSPTADFIPSSIVACVAEPIIFTDQSIIPNPGVITSYRWDFGDGNVTLPGTGTITGISNTTGTYLLPEHYYDVAGVYNVELWVTTDDGCADSITIPVTINALPIVVAGTNQIVCEGVLVTLSGTGALSYFWDNGIVDGQPFTQNVGVNTYTVIGTDINGCENTDQVDVTVNPLPVVSAGPDESICDGESVTLSGTGAFVYVWDNGVMDGVVFTPPVGAVLYTVTGTDTNGCSNIDTVNVTVNALPSIDAGLDQSVCDGITVTLSGAGGTTYVWSNGVIDGQSFIQPVGTITYALLGLDANGCQGTDQVDVTVNPFPVVDAGVDQEVCEGVAVTLSGAGTSTYTWDNGVIDGQAFVQAVGTVTYTVIGTDINGCQGTDQVNVIVNPLPIIDAGPDQIICEGGSVILSGGGGSAYAWDNGVIDLVSFSPAIGTLMYTVIGTDLNGCSNSDVVDVTVNPLPIIDAGVDQTVCEGDNVVLFGTGALT
ncbi:MAG: PKD domain-containing protein, partial [Crocinitomicaceae bacterium]|nr:PKD domain-containing protein [Crocinitomicaceae bacterium]